MEKYAVIVAGGSGQRMGAGIPKQFLPIQGKPLLYHTLSAFLNAYPDMQIILVLPANHLEEGSALINEFEESSRIRVTTGGETRFHSVRNGLQLISQPSIVFVHDGVRCMVSSDLIRRCYEQAVAKGSAIPAVTATDTLRMADGEEHNTINRDNVKIIQTPQTFQSSLLIEAFRQEYDPSFTDEAIAVEASGQEVYLIDGDYNNIKVTRPVDLCIAENLLSKAIS